MAVNSKRSRQRLNPRKLLLSKWTAVAPQNREKHFLVVRMLEPSLPDGPVEQVEVEAVYSRRRFLLHWTELTKPEQWLQGWQ